MQGTEYELIGGRGCDWPALPVYQDGYILLKPPPSLASEHGH